MKQLLYFLLQRGRELFPTTPPTRHGGRGVLWCLPAAVLNFSARGVTTSERFETLYKTSQSSTKQIPGKYRKQRILSPKHLSTVPISLPQLRI